MTATHAPDRQPAAAGGAVLLARLERVLGTGGVEATARREMHAQQSPGTDRQHQNPRRYRGSGRYGVCVGHAASSRTACSNVVTWSRNVAKGSVMTDRSAATR